MNRVVREARMPAGTVFYSFRHNHVSKALLAGVRSQVVAENLGTSVAMLERNYVKFMESDRRTMFNTVKVGEL